MNQRNTPDYALTKETDPRPELASLDNSGLLLSKAIRKKIALMGSDNGSPVLILGATGVGKTAVAKLMHQASKRHAKPFSHTNVAAIPAGLAESELFGHARGSFTDARKQRLGLMKTVGEGTLFLDEIGHLAMEMQAKLLLAIEERVIRPVGADEPTTIDCRIIAATNVNIREAIDNGKFREDLYHRLSKWILRLPSLSERSGEIPLFAEHFLTLNNAKHLELNDDAMQELQKYSWPGNIREFKTVIDRLCHIDAFTHGDSVPRMISAREIRQCIESEYEEVESIDGEIPIVARDETAAQHTPEIIPERMFESAQQIFESTDATFLKHASAFKKYYLEHKSYGTNKKQIAAEIRQATILRAFVYLHDRGQIRSTLGDLIGLNYAAAYAVLKGSRMLTAEAQAYYGVNEAKCRITTISR